MTKAIAILAAFGLLFGTLEVKHQNDVGFAWETTCALMLEHQAVDCGDLQPPVVFWKRLPMYNWGAYRGGSLIIMNRDLRYRDTFKRHAVLIHEMVHYIHVQLEAITIPGYASQVCWSEAVAFEIEGKFTGDFNPLWWVPYDHCRQFYVNEIEITIA